MKYLVIVLSVLVLNTATAANKKSVCATLDSCINLVSKLTSKKYLIDKNVKGSVKLSKNFKITKENADNFLSEVLNLNGFTRVLSKPDQWTVINSRDIRYHPSKSYNFGTDKIPNNHDYATVTIKLKNKFIGSEVSRSFRPFMSRYGRIIHMKKLGVIVLSDTGKNLHRLLSLLGPLDKAPTKSELDKYEEESEKSGELKKLRAKNCSDIKGELDEIKRLLEKK